MTRLLGTPGRRMDPVPMPLVRAVCELMKEPEAADVSRRHDLQPIGARNSEIQPTNPVRDAGRPVRFGTCSRLVLLLTLAVSCCSAGAQVDRFYGEPIELKSDFIYFTSWKYVRQGGFSCNRACLRCDRRKGTWARGSKATARVRRGLRLSDMPRGIRLVAQKAEKRLFQPGQLAAQVFDERQIQILVHHGTPRRAGTV